MSFTSGLGTLQNLLGSLATAAARDTNRTGSVTDVAASAVSRQSSDGAKLSSGSGLVSAALSASDVRLDKVASLQGAIASGTYAVSSNDVAGKIVDSLLA